MCDNGLKKAVIEIICICTTVLNGTMRHISAFQENHCQIFKNTESFAVSISAALALRS